MTDFDRTNTGALFKNDEKQNDRSPDYSGNMNVDGVEFFFDAWIKTAKTGRKFLSCRVKPKQQKQAPRRQASDEDCPF